MPREKNPHFYVRNFWRALCVGGALWFFLSSAGGAEDLAGWARGDLKYSFYRGGGFSSLQEGGKSAGDEGVQDRASKSTKHEANKETLSIKEDAPALIQTLRQQEKKDIHEVETDQTKSSDSSALSTQDVAPGIRIEEAVSLALQNSDELKAAKAKVESVSWEKWGAYSQYLPSIEATYATGAERSMPGSYNAANGMRVRGTTHNRRDRSLFFRQPLIDMAAFADMMRAKGNADIAETEMRDLQETVAFNTTKTFFSLLQAQKSMLLTEAYKKALEKLANKMRLRLDAGGATRVDVDRIESRIMAASTAEAQIQSDYRIALSEFSRLVGASPEHFVSPSKLKPSVPQTEKEARQAVLKTNLSYKVGQKRIDVAESDKNKSFNNILPKLSFEVSNVYNYNAGGAAHGNPIDGVYPEQEDTRLMFVARWSLSGGTQLASGLAGQAKAKEMRYRLQDTQTKLEESVRVAYATMLSARTKINLLKTTYETEKRIISDLNDQFLQGQKSLFDLLDAHERFYKTNLELIHELFSEAIGAYHIRLLMGEMAKALLEQGRGP